MKKLIEIKLNREIKDKLEKKLKDNLEEKLMWGLWAQIWGTLKKKLERQLNENTN
jgi:hypothetical protein